jgi:D-glycero-D-manno-heptose 1,7-bisphosphate phosphatase
LKPDWPNIDSSWTLFLDRDGVINEEKPGDYVHHWKEFVFYPGAAEALARLSTRFQHTIVVTNQRGVGKGMTLESNLKEIHDQMKLHVEQLGGKIDDVFFCPDIDQNSPNRKPQSGMALQAKNKYPEIDFHRSIMVGNTLSDMRFGKQLGMTTVFIPSTHPELNTSHPDIDHVQESLFVFYQYLANR